MDFVTRFAPSPTGLLHLGSAFSALTAFDAARAAGGRFLLRIEDIDQGRSRPEFETAMLEDLAWLGVAWEEPVRRQSEHFADYAAALERLKAMGVVYRCFKTRKQIAAEIARAPHDARGDGPDGEVYRGPATPMSAAEQSARAAAGEAFAWRLSMDAARARLGADWDALTFIEEGEGPSGERGEIAARPAALGDLVIARKDAGVSYHLAATHDDALQGVTHVIRGADLFHAAHVHRLLQALMGWPAPRYRHHPILLGEDGARLSKRHGSEAIAAWRARGESPDAVRARLGLD